MVSWQHWLINIAVDIADGLTLGIPSQLLLTDLRNKYDVEIGDLEQIYEMLSQQYNELISSGTEATAQRLLSELDGYSPFGRLRSIIEDKYNQAKVKATEEREQLADVSNRMASVSRDISKKMAERDQTLGKRAADAIKGD